MGDGKDDLESLSREIRKIIDTNRQFLDRIMDDDFEPDGDVAEEPPGEETEEEFEEL
ncbi:hypothetical protein [Geobacter sulfurreducens]|uniref:hypothetical protein n=1 Tax=Geobacter sulfurreducens TaxID=35554 RepID=UPI002CE23F29|nr:hypothetical protein [Geobacter sulfurreducens]HML77065.1 hypothetical protein [Geobacter sulfurreducens]